MGHFQNLNKYQTDALVEYILVSLRTLEHTHTYKQADKHRNIHTHTQTPNRPRVCFCNVNYYVSFNVGHPLFGRLNGMHHFMIT